ncbi:MAG: SDR family oxidoreductase [Planctomycetes bacterium]|nr:SDR family oxidoreductase [Planctomycetota bacterium]
MSTTHVAFVTGAGRGIGAAIARRLAHHGVALILGARSQEATASLTMKIRHSGGQAWPVYLDVSDPETIQEALDLVRDLDRNLGPVDTLVNNAGIAITAPFLRHGREGGEDLYLKHMATNFHGARRMIEALAPAMLERGHGRIVNIGSSAALQGYAYAAAYVASKHALLGYSRCAALDLGRSGVTLNTICPHYVDSPMTEGTVERIVAKTGKSAEETRAFLAAQNPGGALVTEDEVAELALELIVGTRNGAVIELLGGGQRREVESGVANA